jgi:PIN domain nuclease of toxin-antitoxin system
MKLLLDTHTALWWVNEHEKLSSRAKTMLMDDSHMLYISVASVWEIAIKVSIGKLVGLNGSVKAFLKKVEEMPVELLPIEPRHIELVETLPFIHRDPFDRLLVAAAKTDEMIILTADDNIHQYDVQTEW